MWPIFVNKEEFIKCLTEVKLCVPG
jgi:hypothetical protein